MVSRWKAAAAVGVVALAASACSGSATGSGSATAKKAVAGACGSHEVTDTLPTWARAGFSPTGLHTPHVFSAHGDLLAVLFGPPVAYAAPDKATKILWISQTPAAAPLTYEATLEGTQTKVSRQLTGGIGPSGVNLPQAGCWRLTMNWLGHPDTMTLLFR